jgi:hypothetical protein
MHNHIAMSFKDKELEKVAVVANFATVQNKDCKECTNVLL